MYWNAIENLNHKKQQFNLYFFFIVSNKIDLNRNFVKIEPSLFQAKNYLKKIKQSLFKENKHIN